jgi:hypothetical protein
MNFWINESFFPPQWPAASEREHPTLQFSSSKLKGHVQIMVVIRGDHARESNIKCRPLLTGALAVLMARDISVTNENFISLNIKQTGGRDGQWRRFDVIHHCGTPAERPSLVTAHVYLIGSDNNAE